MDAFNPGVAPLPKTIAQLNRERDLKFVEDSWIKCSVLGTKKENIGTIMYDCILRTIPDFYSNKRRGRTLLAQSFEAMISMIVAYSENPRKLETEERILFVRHAHYNMSHELVAAMRQALLLALEQLLAEEWNPQLEQAWTQVWDETSAVVIEHTSQIQQYVECIQDDWDDALALGLPALAAKLQANLMVEMMNKSGPKVHNLFNSTGAKDILDVTNNVAHHFATKNGGEFFTYDGAQTDADGLGTTSMSKTAAFQQLSSRNGNAHHAGKSSRGDGGGSTSKQALAMDVTDLIVTLVHQVTHVEEMTGLTCNLEIDLPSVFARNGKVPDLRRVSAVVFSTMREISAHRWTPHHDASWSWLWSFAVLSKETEWHKGLAERVLAGWRTLNSILRAQLDIELAHTKLPQDFYVEREDSEEEAGLGGTTGPNSHANSQKHGMSRNGLRALPPGSGSAGGALPAVGGSLQNTGIGGVPGLMLPSIPTGGVLMRGGVDGGSGALGGANVSHAVVAAQAAAMAGSNNAAKAPWMAQVKMNFTAQKKKKEYTIEDIPETSSEEEDDLLYSGGDKGTGLGGMQRFAAGGVADGDGSRASGDEKAGGGSSSRNASGEILIRKQQRRATKGSGVDSGSKRTTVSPAGDKGGRGGVLKQGKVTDPGARGTDRGVDRGADRSGRALIRVRRSGEGGGRLAARVPSRIAYKIGVLFYNQIFKKAPTLRRVFVRPAHNYGILFKKILSMMIRHVYNPSCMWNTSQELALRHVNFGMRPSDVPLFGKIFLQVLEDMAGAAWTPAYHSAWSVFWEIGSFGLNCVVIAGSHPATRALILGDRSELLVALREASREQRVEWSCMVELRGNQKSPLEWAIKDGKLKMAELLLREALSLRVDPSNRVYYGADLLWRHHDNLIPFLADMVPQLLPVLLDGLFWTSSQVLEGHRRVVIFGHSLWGDPRHAASGDSVFETPMAVLVKGTYAGSNELFLHPVLDVLTEIKWRLFASRSYIISTCIPVLIQFILFIGGFLSIQFIHIQAQALLRIITWVISLLLAAQVLIQSVRQIRAGHVQPHLPFGLTIATKKSLATSPTRHPQETNMSRNRVTAANHSYVTTGDSALKSSSANPSTDHTNAGNVSQSGAGVGGNIRTPTRDSNAAGHSSSNGAGRMNTPSKTNLHMSPGPSGSQRPAGTNPGTVQGSVVGGTSGGSSMDTKSATAVQGGAAGASAPHSQKKKRGLFRVGVPWALRDLTSWMQLILALLLTVAMISEFTRLAGQGESFMDSEHDFLTSPARRLEWNVCIALANLCIWHSLTRLALVWSPARATVAVVGVLLSSLTFFLTMIIAFAGAFYKSGLLPEFEGFGAVTATLFFLSQGAFEMELPSGQDLEDDGGGSAMLIYNTFLEVLAPIFQLVGGLMLTTLLMADLTAQCKGVLPLIRGLSNKTLCTQCVLEEAKLTDEERIQHTESLPFSVPVVFDETQSHLIGALSLMMSVNHPGLEFAFDRLERFTSDHNTGPDAPWPRQAAEGDAKLEFELATEKQLKHLISTANRVQRLLTLQTQNLPVVAPNKDNNDGESVAGRSSVATHFTNRTGFSIPGLQHY